MKSNKKPLGTILHNGLLSFCLLLSCCLNINAQDYLVKDDSLIFLLKNNYPTISPERIQIMAELISRHIPDQPVYDSLINNMIEGAEESRNRVLLCMTYHVIATSYLSYDQKPEYTEKGKAYADKCMQIATEPGGNGSLNEYKVVSFLNYSRYYINTTQYQKALDYNNQAISLASALGSDSLLCLSYDAIAYTWSKLSNKLSEFQALLNERDFAEKTLLDNKNAKDKSHVYSMVVGSYSDLGSFYEESTDYEKAKDFFAFSIQQAREWGDHNQVFDGLVALGQVFFEQKNEQLGILYYKKAQDYADSLGVAEMKIRIYFDLLNHYFNTNNSAKGFEYLNSHPEIMDFIKNFGLVYQLNKLYAERQRINKNYDSAMYFLRIASPFEYGQKANFGEKYNFSMQMAQLLKQMGRLPEERNTLLLANKFADSAQNLKFMKDVSLELDSVYQQMGDFKDAQVYLQNYDTYRDSIETLSKQKDLLNIEIENENKRADQQKIAEVENKRIRNNVEYLGITAALATVFIILVILGVFKISPSVIKALGFFAFIFLFEFIVLLLDTQIHEITQGEPWKVLGVKIVIIAMLLPLHHWLEVKMLHYLTFKVHKIKPKIFDKK